MDLEKLQGTFVLAVKDSVCEEEKVQTLCFLKSFYFIEIHSLYAMVKLII